MFTLHEHNEEFYRLNEESRRILGEILSEVDVDPTIETRALNQPFFAKGTPADKLILVKDGCLRVERAGRAILFLEAGELVGWGSHFSSELSVVADCDVTVERYTRAQFTAAVQASSSLRELWGRYVECQLKLYASLVGISGSEDTSAPIPERRHFHAGEPIIIQGTSPSEVYTMLNGQADVFVENTKVGAVRTGEIFGAMAATTNMTRSASVIAKGPCIVAVIPKEHFLSLIKTRPTTVLKLIEDMSRIIVSQNEKIVAMSGETYC